MPWTLIQTLNKVEIENGIHVRNQFVCCQFSSGITSSWPLSILAHLLHLLSRQAVSSHLKLSVQCNCAQFICLSAFLTVLAFFSSLKQLRWGLPIHQTASIARNKVNGEINAFSFGFLLKGKTQDAENSSVTVLQIFCNLLEQNRHMYVTSLKIFCIFFAFTLPRILYGHKFSFPW